MRRDAEVNESADKKRKELIEARNEAESVIYQSEKLIKEAGTAEPAAQAQANEQISKLREIMNGEDAAAIKDATKKLMDMMGVLAQAAQKAGAQAGAGAQQQGAQQSNDGETVDAEFHEEDNR